MIEKNILTIIKQCILCGEEFIAGIHSERVTCEICLNKVIADTAYELTDVELANLVLEDDATQLAEVDDEVMSSSEVDNTIKGDEL